MGLEEVFNADKASQDAVETMEGKVAEEADGCPLSVLTAKLTQNSHLSTKL